MSEAAVETKAEKLNRTTRRTIQGHVVSNKMAKTVVVQAARLTKHPMYGKYYKKFKKYKVHDEENTCDVGDLVEIIESRPISKHKFFRLKRIVEKVKKVELGA